MNYTAFNDKLLDWYYHEQRNLPWRQTDDPYKIWLSEVMLQQTQVKTVIPYYEKFINKYPTLDSIANEDSESLLKAWEGLGYYNRIRNFHSAVQEVQASYHSFVPNTPKTFMTLRGVGPYIGGAVQSIAFNHKVAAVDGNVLRVMTRILEDSRDITKQKTVRSMKEYIESFMPDNAGDFNQALMELGATVCLPRAPRCITCPVQQFCLSFKNNSVIQYPNKPKNKAKTEVYLNTYIILNNNDQILMFKETSNLLEGLYYFPQYDVDTSISNIEEKLNIEFSSYIESMGQVVHVFTHKKWFMNVYLLYTNNTNKNFVPLQKVRNYPMSVAMQKVFKLIEETV